MKTLYPPAGASSWPDLRKRLWALTAALGLAAMSTCSPSAPLLERVQALGKLRVATVNSPTTYYDGPTGPTGFEYDLARGLAEQLGVELEVEVEASAADVIDSVLSGHAHFGAAGLAVTPRTQALVLFTPPIHHVVPELVYKMGQSKPKDLGDLDGSVLVPTQSTYAELLIERQSQFTSLNWRETDEFSTEELIARVSDGQIAYTVANSDLVAINQRYYPNVRVAFPVSASQDIAWAFAPGDESLFGPAVTYVKQLSEQDLVRIRDQHFGHVDRVDYVGTVALATHVETRLPSYRSRFEEAAAANGLDWRLLAAVGYQESHWDPAAVSPTGVRGIMQITKATAKFLDVDDRLDPTQSIDGAARYLKQLKERLPEEIPEPDRTWLTLATYNIGLGHVLDIRELTVNEFGGDPNRWVELRKYLPLLTQPKWHSKTRHGYARGHEAVTYVGNIRAYYDMLVWITSGGQGAPPAPDEEEAAPPREREKTDPLKIDSPIL